MESAREAGTAFVAGIADDPTMDRPVSGLRANAWRWTLALSAILIAVHPLLEVPWRQVAYYPVGLVAVVGILVGIRMHGVQHPLPWVLMAAGQLSFLLGDGMWDLYEFVLPHTPSPSAADFLYLGGYPLMAAGLALLFRRRSAGTDRAGLIDASIITVGAGVVTWVFLLAPYASDATLTTPERLIALAYPLGDLLLLSIAVRLFLVPGAASRAHRLFGAGLIALLLVDAAYLAMTTAGVSTLPMVILEMGWLASYVLLGTAALDPTIGRRRAVPTGPVSELTRGRLRLLAGASLLAPATLVVQALTGGDTHPLLVAGTSAVLFLLVVRRMSGLVRRVEDQARQLALVARTDALTGLLNRRAWDEQLPVELLRAERDETPVSVALLDLDHFKAYNDLAGHPAGDQLLREAAAAWRGELRGIDVLVRYGGEEFGLVLPAGDAGDAAEIVDRLRALTPAGETSSGGVAQWDGLESAEALVARADRALYAAKRGGRDRTVLAELDPAELPV